ncbi:MAG: two component signal transduction system envelope stress histidine kinase BaeS [Idiomarinaceae bacterium HL-53]|nr:MAG: two component signal transduction system envelope stress histidine kinase BaeS [Idiomarinaceae bacterium HL-53]CUS47684.1 two-component system, OmpR family, sensor histidine kinase BaeS [Idiomarinaceae bacterium HL-53]
MQWFVNLKTRTQLFLAIAGTGVLLIVLVLWGIRNLFLFNFQSYMEAQERERLSQVAVVLSDYYRNTLRNPQRRRVLSEEATELVIWREAIRSIQRDLLFDPERFSTDTQLSFTELNLYTPDGERVFGPLIEAPITVPVLNDNQIVGLLSTVKPVGATAPIDEVFARQQVSESLYAGVFAVVLGALVAWGVSVGFRRRIRQLAEVSDSLARGHYQTRSSLAGKDDIAELARDMNQLGAALQRGQQQRQRMLADIAHELRTPLTVLQGEVESVQDGIRQPDKAHFERLHHHVTHLTRLVNDLHQLAQADAGALSYEWQVLNLSELLQALVEEYAYALEQAGLDVKFEMVPTAAPIRADQDRLRQALMNVFSNCIRYVASPGTIWVSLEASGPSQWRLIIEDSGPGLTKEQCALLGERLYRPDASRSRAAGGSGLGLAITKAIVHAHGGALNFMPSSKGGLKVEVNLPSLERST